MEDNGRKTWYDGSMKKGRRGAHGCMGFPFCSVFYELRLSSDGLRRRHLSLREERYRRKTRQRAPKPPFGNWLLIRGVGGETCVVFTNSPKCNLRDLGPSVACSALLPRTRLYCS
nr:MAG TPA: hypothetical protein [Caudoviricetes sp.]